MNDSKGRIKGFVEKHQKGLKILALVLLAGTMVLRGAMQIPGIRSGKEKIDELNKQIEYENQRQNEISALAKKSDSDEYIEKIASERLGLIKSNSKIFIDVSGE